MMQQWSWESKCLFKLVFLFSSNCCSVGKLCLTPRDSMDCSMPGFPVLTVSWSLPKFMSIASVMSSNHLILCLRLLLLPSIFPSIRVLFNELDLRIRWLEYWSFSFSIHPSNEYSGLISFKIDWFDLPAVQGTRVFSSTTVQKHQFLSALPSLWSSSHNCTWLLERPWPYGPLLANWCLYFLTYCLALSQLSCQEAMIILFHGCSHNPQWFYSPRRGNLSLLPPFHLLFVMK